MIKAAVFDIDGTLIDSVDLHARAWQQALAHFGHQLPYELVRYQIGKGGDQLIPVFLTPEEQQQYGKTLHDYRAELFKKDYLPQVKAFANTRELFQHMQSDHIQTVLASSAKEDELETYKRIARIDDIVRQETSADDAERSKPHPDIFEAALASLHEVNPEEVVVVGDSPYDAEAARKIGITSIGVRSGGSSDLQLDAAGFSAIYNDCADLLSHYQQSLFASHSPA